MALKVKAKEQLIKVGKYADEGRAGQHQRADYLLRP